MDTAFLKSLISVVDTGSIAAAAQRENVTASAIRQRITVLETQMGTALLTRVGRGVQPTLKCQNLLPAMRRLVTEASQLTFLANPDAGAGEFRLGAIDTGLTDTVPDLLAQMKSRGLSTELRITPGSSSHLYALLLDEALDAVLCVRPPMTLPKSLVFHELEKQMIGVLQSGDRRAEFLSYDQNSWGGGLCWAAAQSLGAEPKVFCELDALPTIAALIQTGFGWSVVPKWAGLETTFPELNFDPIDGHFRSVGVLYRHHLADHPLIKMLHLMSV